MSSRCWEYFDDSIHGKTRGSEEEYNEERFDLSLSYLSDSDLELFYAFRNSSMSPFKPFSMYERMSILRELRERKLLGPPRMR